jgi:predicted Zn-dependent protease
MQNRRMADAVMLLLAVVLTARCAAQQTVPTQTPADDLGLAQANLDNGHYVNSEKLLRGYLANHPTDAGARYLLAYTLFRENKPADSLNEYTAAAKLRTPHEADLKIVALDYVLLKDYPDAQHWIHSALSLDANDAEGCSSIATSLMRRCLCYSRRYK